MAHDHAVPAPPAPPGARHVLTVLAVGVAAATVAGLVLLWPDGSASEVAVAGAPDALLDATVTGVARGPCEGTPPDAGIDCARLTIRLEEGSDAGSEVVLPELSEGGGAPQPEVGDGVVVGYTADAQPPFRYYFADLERRTPLWVLGALFVAAVLALGRGQGVRALCGLAASLMVIVLFVLPAVLQGANPLLVALVGASAIAFLALYLAHGVNARTTAALLGTLGSLALTGVLGLVFVDLARFTGLAAEEAGLLQLSAAQVDLRGLLLGGIVIGALGVLDDVTVTQVSAVWELRRANPRYGAGDLYRAALRIGRDHIASTVNTLVLAYAGASLPLLLLFTQADQALSDVLNAEVVAVEVVRTVVGSLGLVASVPLTTALAAVVVSGPREGARRRRPRPDPRRHRDDPREARSRAERRFWGEEA